MPTSARRWCASLIQEKYPEARVLPELGLEYGLVRVDLAVLSPALLHGYEVKADADTLRRLPRHPPNCCIVADSPGNAMNRMKVFAIVGAVLLAGAAVAVVVLRGRTVAPESSEAFAAGLELRPKCWVKVKSPEPGKCPDYSQLHKGKCYMPNWDACAKYY
ncbi:hypothetical protein G4177_06185 [Corallococcus sp. ZKHCc1 1396]|uniref:Uncharacterized protein n=1 Tax=Corallococcus soli TaxID=2710757 RepID=A0ABR9PIP0_9BACT|nr:hypothetical protein [Corallococcus soli]MBE4747767.1 hypothetical protein [Corallococcus soli]